MNQKESNPILNKSFAFAIRCVNIYRYLSENKEFIMSKQLLRSGTAIGALVREAQHAESKADFIHKSAIALKEANETCYWIELLHQTRYINENMYTSMHKDAEELIKILVTIIKSAKNSRK
jgi:four helix bundle protein